ncbi:hypothetical protein J2S49_001123 [Arcanobacterium wilhelmae]|uniref:Uncharacterized protein n=1 Tax=Arcanobacterium wilhelmae TaxID=1803177 RepID=A0ABT9NBK2_9ACTO|nr:hypothetical protein [Arcanobacterium wilhelmae]MDP9801047.1 hypothetical protein [Arcanobacterium wilhelmae]WFN90404.1 hypothetical protein P8A24_00645 [Arcanobacterium wilhelmae]
MGTYRVYGRFSGSPGGSLDTDVPSRTFAVGGERGDDAGAPVE